MNYGARRRLDFDRRFAHRDARDALDLLSEQFDRVLKKPSMEVLDLRRACRVLGQRLFGRRQRLVKRDDQRLVA